MTSLHCNTVITFKYAGFLVFVNLSPCDTFEYKRITVHWACKRRICTCVNVNSNLMADRREGAYARRGAYNRRFAVH